MTKKKSSQEVARDNVEKLQNWLDGNPTIPIYHGGANKTEICRILGITKSTIGTNLSLRNIFTEIEQIAEVQQKKLGTQQLASPPCISDSMRTCLKEKDNLIKWLKKELDKAQTFNEQLQQEAATEELLILTGRYVTPAFNPQSNTTNTDEGTK
ncbi:MAG: hypothetical protein WBF78_06520 [Vibrio anguillarum]